MTEKGETVKRVLLQHPSRLAALATQDEVANL
jgi:hypothetical protein